MSERSIVAIEEVREDVRAAVRRALSHAEWETYVPAGADVALKVNLGWNLFIPGAITSPLFLECLIEAIRGRVGTIYVVEADQVLERVEPAFHASGIAAVCRRTGCRWINMSHEPTEIVECPENLVLKRIAVPRILRNALLISVPVIKTHAKTRITGALKNQWGCLPLDRHELHPVLDRALADLNRVIRPVFSAMDATIGLEGNGPKSGSSRIVNRVLCSADPVALDTVQALLMGVDPNDVGHLHTCAASGVGTNDLSRIELRGAKLDAVVPPFTPASHNAVSRVETWLRNSPLEPLVFRTPLFALCLSGAELYYRAWTRLYAARSWSLARQHPIYGEQWRSRDES